MIRWRDLPERRVQTSRRDPRGAVNGLRYLGPTRSLHVQREIRYDRREVIVERRQHRGAAPDDERMFGPSQLPILRTAAHEVVWLLDRGYRMEPSISFVGGHHQLEARQRSALTRAVCSSEQQAGRRARAIPAEQLAGRMLAIDGFNVVIAVEVALSKGMLLEGMDGGIRDMAGLRGSYHLVTETAPAIELVGRVLTDMRVAGTRWFLDAPVSNSGRLRAAILELAEGWPFSCEVELVPNPDPILSGLGGVASCDAAILDRCQSWCNLAGLAIEQHVPEAWRVRLWGN